MGELDNDRLGGLRQTDARAHGEAERGQSEITDRGGHGCLLSLSGMGVSGPISWVVNGLGSGLRAACQPAVGPCPAGIGLRKNLRAVRTTTTGRGQVRRAQDRAGSGFPGAQPQRGSPNRAFLVIVEAASPQVTPLCSRAPEAGGHPPIWLAETAEFPPRDLHGVSGPRRSLELPALAAAWGHHAMRHRRGGQGPRAVAHRLAVLHRLATSKIRAGSDTESVRFPGD